MPDDSVSPLARRLRDLPGFPADLEVLDPERTPSDPTALLLAWLEDAIASGERQPHGMTLVTVRQDGTPVGRTLILKDLDERGLHFSTHRSSRKGMQLEHDARASMVFWWKETGRQARVTGTVRELPAEESARDWKGRPTYTGRPDPDWQLYALDPSEYEFMQAREDRHHTRLEYRRDGTAWSHGPVTTPAG